jgi:regulator of sigma D
MAMKGRLQMTSEKQRVANKVNASKGGVKSTAGKGVSKYNAQKHSIFRQSITDYEEDSHSEILSELIDQYSPQGAMENVLVERIAVHYIKLFRIQKAETEYMMSQLNPREAHTEGGMQLIQIGEPLVTIIDNEGYIPTLHGNSIEYLSTHFSRYETAMENKMYKALHELERLQRMRQGENVPSPIPVDVTLGSFGNN